MINISSSKTNACPLPLDVNGCKIATDGHFCTPGHPLTVNGTSIMWEEPLRELIRYICTQAERQLSLVSGPGVGSSVGRVFRAYNADDTKTLDQVVVKV